MSSTRCFHVVTRRSRHVALTVVAAIFATAPHAQEPAPRDDGVEEVFVLGRGETRQVQTVTAQQIEQLPAGTSPLKAIENFPGVNFQSADPYGAYEWSTRITVRGFNQNRLGFTLDGVPLGDMTYGNHNGLHISRAIPSELVGSVTLSQGTGSLDTASASNLGGSIEFFSADPDAEFGVNAAQTFGSDSARRTFARLDSGELGSGTRAYLTVVDSSTEKWKGAGDQKTQMFNAKLVHPVGDGALTAYYNYSDRVEIDYQDLSFDIIRRRGRDWDNLFPNWNGAVAAGQACNASGGNDAIACDDAYWSASGLRQDDLGYVALNLPFGDALEWTATGYFHQNDGQGLWGTPYTPTPGGAPLSIRTTEYDLNRKGVVTALTWTPGNHEVNGGLWYETNDFTQARRFYGEPSLAAPTRSFEDFQTNPMLTQWEYDFDTETVVFHLQDTWSLTDGVRVNVGFRSVNSENTANTVVGDVKTGTIEADEPFLPQVGLTWALPNDLELFASAARNVRAFASSGTSGPFSTSAAGFAAIRDVIEPETSTNLETGLRFRAGAIDGVVAVYHVDFNDRLLGIQQGPGIVGNPSVLANVGSVKTNGVEAALTWRPMTNLSWFSSVAWNDSEYDDDYTVTNSSGVQRVVPVSGKQVTDAPEILFKSELAYDNGAFFARADVNYTDERFYTYLNQGGVDAYTLLNIGVGYRFTGLGVVEDLVLQADATNLTDE
ncbi:MAG TPA: TonB-dependent receptor, partial [Gammaproteobacteria bacterium]|nr:TonB-dependent receptor [Gammaproteobacteria bacterium]